MGVGGQYCYYRVNIKSERNQQNFNKKKEENVIIKKASR